MDERGMNRCPVSAARTRAFGVLFTALLLAASGCMTGPSAVVLPEDFVAGQADTPSAEQTLKNGSTANGQDHAAEPAATALTAKPRTVTQAVHAYLERLRAPKPAAEEEAKNGADADKPNAKGGNSENGAINKNLAKGEKSRPATGAQKKDSDGASGETNPDSLDKEGKEKNGKKEEKKEEDSISWYSAHAQATMDTQVHSNFNPPYSGPLSLRPNEPAATSVTATLFLAARLWECGNYTGDVVFNPELAGGRGLSNVNGLAGFPNGDITRVGVEEPTPYIARLFLRQTWGLGGEQEKVEDEANQIAGKRDVERVTLIAGKFAFTDVIDTNRYSHDPRSQMQNWSLMYNGAWDYPANVRGYDYGFAVDYNQKDWALRYGMMAEPKFANAAAIDQRFTDAFGQALEWEGRWTIDKHPGKVRVMAFLNRAHMGDYREALLAMPMDPDVTLTRSYRYKYGFGLNFEQEITRDLGVWGRLGWGDGHTEAWAFTPIDRTAALGLLLKGRCWARPNDEAGLAGVCNGLAKDHRDYLAAGGLDFNIGDGRLDYGLEDIIEIYYRCAVIKGIYVTADLQEIFNPAYNMDRGPVTVGALLVHIEL